MTRRVVAPLALAMIALLPACGGADRPAPEPEPAPASHAEDAAAPAEPGAPAETPPRDEAPLAKATVTLFFPSAAGDTLATETREIVDTSRPAERGAQIVAALLDGPRTEGALPAFPAGTTLRKLWVRDDGNAYADFSEELARAASGGSADEILTVYAIVDSLTENVPAIRRVGILIAGREGASLGHLDLRRPLPPDLSLAPRANATE